MPKIWACGTWHPFSPSDLPPIAGTLLDHFQIIGKANGLPMLGYTVIFSIARVYFALGMVFVGKIKGVR